MGFSEQAQLSELHRLAQSKLQTVVAGDVAKVFPLLDVANVDATFGNYYDSMKKVLTARRTVSSSLGASLYSGIRKDVGIKSQFTPLLDAAINEKQLFTSLLVTGPISIKRSIASGASLEQANANALSSTIRASQRHVANGGRGTIINAAKRDKSAKGWARLTDSKPCSFCAMLASRGPVYKSEQTSRFRSHDGCGCSAVPVVDLEAPWPGRAEEFRKLYDENISGKYSGGDGNNDAVKAWKQFYDRKVEPDAFNQARNVAEELVAKATAYEPQLTSEMTDLADRFDGTLEGLDYRLKEVDSLTRKINKEVIDEAGKKTVEQAGADMFDVNRYTMTLADDKYVSGAQAMVDELRASGNTVNVKNYWQVADNPYQGINIQVTTPTGAQYELQFHTVKSLEVKEGALHSIYEKARKTKDLVKLARYNKESFLASAKIPVPRGIEGIISGRGTPVVDVVKTVKKVAKKAAAKVAAPGWRSAWEEAAAKLPKDRANIGRVVAEESAEAVTNKEFLIAEARIRAEAKFTDDYTKLNAKKPKTSGDYSDKRRALDALKAAYGKSIGKDLTFDFNATIVAERKASKEALEILKTRKAGGTIELVERDWAGGGKTLSSGSTLDADLDTVLAAGKALGTELDERIAKRILNTTVDDGSAEIAQLALKKTIYERDLAAVKEALIKWETDPAILSQAEIMTVDRLSRPDLRNLTREELKAGFVRTLLAREDKVRRLRNKEYKLTNDFSSEKWRSESRVKKNAGLAIEPGTIAYADIQREEVLKLLAEIREIGGSGASYVSVSGKKVSKELIEAMDFAHSSYPSDWMKIVRERYPVVELGKITRGHNGSGIEIKLSDGSIQLTGDKGLSAVAVHELGHSMQEAIPGLKQLDFAYRSRRGTLIDSAGTKTTERRTWTGSGSKDEVSIKDSWRNAYSGKVYGNNDLGQVAEVFTTGIESLLAGSPYMNAATAILEPDVAKLLYDKEFRDYMLGVLSVL